MRSTSLETDNQQSTGGVTLAALREHLTRRTQKLPFELAAYIGLELSERMGSMPTQVDLRRVFITGDGAIQLSGDRKSAEEAAAVASVTRLIGDLLAHGPSTSVPPRLQSVIRGSDSAGRTLASLTQALRAAVLPMNRDAARRMLVRFVRDVREQAAESDTNADEATPTTVVTTISERVTRPASGALLWLPKSKLRPAGDTTSVEVKRLPEGPAVPALELPQLVAAEPPIALESVPPPHDSEPLGGADDLTGPSLVRDSVSHEDSVSPDDSVLLGDSVPPEASPDAVRFDSHVTWVRPKRSHSRGMRTAVLVVALLSIAGAATYAALQTRAPQTRAVSAGPIVSASKKQPARGAAPTSASKDQLPKNQPESKQVPTPAEAVRLRIQGGPAHVFLRVGRGPVTVDGLSVSQTYAFLSTHELGGYALAWVRPGSAWLGTSSAGPSAQGSSTATPSLYELALQPRPGVATRSWDKFRETAQSVSRITHELENAVATYALEAPESGRVRIVTDPPGSEVYRYLGYHASVELRDIDRAANASALVLKDGFDAARLVIDEPGVAAGERVITLRRAEYRPQSP